MKTHRIWVAAGWLGVVGLGVGPGPVMGAGMISPPMITGYQARGCVKKGDQLVVQGTGLGQVVGATRVVLWGRGVATDLMVGQRFDSQLTVVIPNDARVVEGAVYQVGFRDASGRWVGSPGPMLTICEAAPSAAAVAPVAGPATIPDRRAIALADQVRQASGADQWAKVKAIRFTFNVGQGDKPLLAVTHRWEVRAGTDQVSWAGKTVTVNLLQPGTDADAKAAYQRWVNDSYWLLAPLKLRDPGVHLAYLGQQQVDDKPYEVLRLRFANVGLTPGDEYNLYIDPATHLLRRWDYLPAPGKKTTGTWDKYQEFGGLKLATEHEFGDKRIWFTDVAVETE